MNSWRTNDFQRVHLITAQISLTVLWKKSKWYLFVEQSVLWLSRLTIIACGLYLLRVTLVTLIMFSEAFILPVDNDLQMRCPRTMAPLIDKWSEKQLETYRLLYKWIVWAVNLIRYDCAFLCTSCTPQKCPPHLSPLSTISTCQTL